MSETPVEKVPAQDPSTETPQDGEKPDWKSESRKWESRAKANADAAEKLAKLEEAQKSAEEKAAERESAAEKRAVAAEAKALRREVALESALSAEDAKLLDGVTDEDSMRALAARLAKKEDAKRGSNHVPGEGKNQDTPTDERRAFVRRLTGKDN